MAFPYIEGGLTVDPAFISTRAEVTPTTYSQISPQSTIITGEDGVRYYVGGGQSGAGGNGTTLYVVNADTNVVAFTRTGPQLQVDADAAGVTTVPINNNLGQSNLGYVDAYAIPETPCFIVIGGGAGGLSTSKRVLYYKINSDGDPELLGGYAGRVGGLDVQFSPPQSAGDAFSAEGFIITNPVAGSNNNIQYAYPIALAYYGEGRSTITIVPSINYILVNSPIVEDTSNNWLAKEADAGLVFGDNNILRVLDNTAVSSRGFFLPRPGGGARLALMFYNTTLDAVNAGTEAISSNFLDTYAPLYPNGLMSAIDVVLSIDGSPFGFTTTLGSVTPAFHSIIKNLDFTPAFPFEDDEENYDGSAGTAAENYYANPTVYPSNVTDPDAPWFLFFPRIYRKSGDRDKMGIRVCAYDPVEDVIYNLDFGKGQMYTLGVDVDADTNPNCANVWWNRDTGRIDLLIRSESSGEAGFITVTFGSFSPVTATSTASEELLTRAWAFNLDSHSFYPLRLGQQGTFVYDLYTQQWSQWQTQGYEIWNAVHGVAKWNGMIVAGDIADGTIWQVDPDATLDEDTKPITHTVTGILSNRERSPQRLMELRVAGSVGAPYIAGAAVTLSWSDDQGQTYSTPITVNLESGNNSQVVRFRSLGRFDSPLRIFDITDVGGMVRIDGVDVELK